MFLLKVLGIVFVSSILFTPEYFPKDAFAACCPCNACKRGCTCGCSCGDEGGKQACIEKLDKEKSIVQFKDKSTGELFELPYVEELLDNKKIGDCGMIKTKYEQVQVCTGFAMQISPPQKQELQKHQVPMSE